MFFWSLGLSPAPPNRRKSSQEYHDLLQCSTSVRFTLDLIDMRMYEVNCAECFNYYHFLSSWHCIGPFCRQVNNVIEKSSRTHQYINFNKMNIEIILVCSTIRNEHNEAGSPIHSIIVQI